MISVKRPYIKGYMIRVARTDPKAKRPPKFSGKRNDKYDTPMAIEGIRIRLAWVLTMLMARTTCGRED
jgi:hypothetical protein